MGFDLYPFFKEQKITVKPILTHQNTPYLSALKGYHDIINQISKNGL